VLPTEPTASGAFAAQLRRSRRSAGLTQAALAERAGLSVRAVSDLERGLKAPQRATVDLLARALALPPEEAGALALAAQRRRARREDGVGPPRHNLPVSLTSFVGRGRELAEVARLLGASRLLTLTGAGGCGKTRLALQIAESALPAFPDGAWFVDLAPLAEDAAVARATLAALGLAEPPGRSPEAAILEHMRHRCLLLVLDNCEHLIAACARLAEALLQRCPEAKMLATSREALGMAGEVAYRVPPLGLPDPLQPLDLEAALRAGAVRLFAERAALVRPNFTLTAGNAAAVVETCRRLDGIPLAIELAAARLRVLAPAQLLARLDGRFRLLTGGRTALRRQQTLQATIDWSHDLLSAPERRLFNRLSVFSGDWTLEAAEAVAGDGPAACGGVDPSSGGMGDSVQQILPDDVLDLLTRLADRSVVVAEAGPEGQERYRLLETLRQYGREKLLAGGEAEAVHERHAWYYLEFAEAAGRKIRPESYERSIAYYPAQMVADVPELRVGLARFEREQDNITAALRWLIEQQDAERAVRLVQALMAFWIFRGGGEAASRYLTDLLALCRAVAAPPPVLAGAVGVATGLASLRGDHSTARALFEEYRQLTREATGANAEQEAAWLSDSALIVRNAGEWSEAQTLLEQSLAIYQQLGNDDGIATQHDRLGGLAHLRGEYALARRQYEAALRIQRPASTLKNLGRLALDEADSATARPLLEESLRIRRRPEVRLFVVLLLANFSALLAAEGQPESALRLAGAVETLALEMGFGLPPMERRTLARWTEVARQALGEGAAAAAITAGRALSLEEALAVALAEPA